MANEKYALLDTDFISKMYLIRKDDTNRLIDKIMAMPDYIFYCHKQISIEVLQYNNAGLSEWLEAEIVDQAILLYDDEAIVDELSEIYGELAPVAYIRMLRMGCDAYRDGYYEENFAAVSKLDAYKITREDFLEKLKLDCDAMGAGRNLGELKSYVLLQFLNMKFGEQIYVFCSDDKNARNGMVAIGGANCISVLSSFIRLRKEIGLSREEAEPYIRSYLSYCLGKGQTTFRIQENSKERRMRKVPCEQVFDELFAGRMDEMKTGNLKYR